jgi:DNA-binding SARP family transcriptional activator
VTDEDGRQPPGTRPDPAPGLRFSVLGPVQVRDGATLLPGGSPQQRALLVALLLRDGHTATAAELMDALWDDSPPSRAVAALRTYISRLRKILGPAALVSEAGGYTLRIPDGPDALDVTRAEALAAAAGRARETGDARLSRDLLQEALALWRGDPLAGTPGPYAQAQRVRLREWRLQLLESRLALDLDLGRHEEAVSELSALTAEQPLMERPRELLMVALYRSGRQAEALAVYTETRHLLADELGVDPGPRLAELRQRILRDDPLLSAPRGSATPGLPTAHLPGVRPAQLPATAADFTGRGAELAELTGVLSAALDADSRVVTVAAVAGLAGSGKTALAVHAAHAVRAAFPDGQLHVPLGATSGGPADTHRVLHDLLLALGTAPAAVPEALEARAALYRSLLADRRVLVVLDDARDAAQVRPLLPGTEGCAALITSRTRMVDLAGAHLLDLDVMEPDEALGLFTRIVGPERAAAERDAALDTVAACGFLPLAVRIAASRIAARRTWTIGLLAARLADARRRLDELHTGGLSVAAALDRDHDRLAPAQARAFRLLALADGPEVPLPAAAALLGLDEDATETVLESLVDASLLDAPAPGRYRFHDLVRLHARRRAALDESPGDRAAALERLVQFHLTELPPARTVGGIPSQRPASGPGPASGDPCTTTFREP